MDSYAAGSIAGIGLIGGFMSGFLGIGGGVIMIPLLLYVAATPIKLATGLSIAQALAATVSGVLVHRRNRTVDFRLGAILGMAGFVGALTGALGSAALDAQLLLSSFWLLVVLALALLLFAPRHDSRPGGESAGLWLTLPTGFVVGLLAGMLGVGGGFVLIPLMTSVLRVPLKMAVGTSLLVVLAISLAGGAGKIVTGQFDAAMAAYLVLGAVAGAQLGGVANSWASSRTVRSCLLLLLVTILVWTGLHQFVAALH